MSDLVIPSEVQRLVAQAVRRTTPCGAGDLVWHVWGQARPGVRPLVLLHGGSGSWTHWVRNLDALVAAGHQLWVPDLPGFGDSAPPLSGAMPTRWWPRCALACNCCWATRPVIWWGSLLAA
jgi:2-hydroxy-6-oxonona-2,4-dienedioate hydrolase